MPNPTKGEVEETYISAADDPFAPPLSLLVCKQGKRSGRSSPTDQVSATHDGAGNTGHVKCEAKRNARFLAILDDKNFHKIGGTREHVSPRP